MFVIFGEIRRILVLYVLYGVFPLPLKKIMKKREKQKKNWGRKQFRETPIFLVDKTCCLVHLLGCIVG